MPSSDNAQPVSLLRPVEWPEPGGVKYRLMLIVMVLLALLCVPVGFTFVAIDKPGGVKYCLLFGVLLLTIAAFAYVTRVRPKHGEEDIVTAELDGRRVTELRYSSLGFGALVLMMVCVTAFVLLAAVDFYFSIPGEVTAPLGATVVFGLIGLFLASFLVLVATGRIQRGKLVLSQRGIHQRGWTFSSFLPWESFAGMKASFDGQVEYVLVVAYANAPWEKRQIVKFWKIDKLPPVPMIAINCLSLAIDPNLVYWLVKFYVENPPARVELGTEAAIQRVRARAFT
jgi:hypothetical protein